jgi:hypothetical protein
VTAGVATDSCDERLRCRLLCSHRGAVVDRHAGLDFVIPVSACMGDQCPGGKVDQNRSRSVPCDLLGNGLVPVAEQRPYDGRK